MLKILLKIAAGGAALSVLTLGAYVGYASATVDTQMSFPTTPYPNVVASTDPAIIEQGRYLVNGPAHCIECHSTSNRDAPAEAKTEPLHGGLEFAMGPFATTWSANLTPDPETGIAGRTDAELARTIRTGVLADGQWSMMMGLSSPKPADEDLVAIISYLRSLPPVRYDLPSGLKTAARMAPL